MHKVLISLPDQLASRMKATIPERQRSKIVAELIEMEIARREKALFECALAVENDLALKEDLNDWDVTVSDGLDRSDQETLKRQKRGSSK